MQSESISEQIPPVKTKIPIQRKAGENMLKYKVDHNGSVQVKDKEGKYVDILFQKNVPVELPDDAVRALGDAAKPTTDAIPEDGKKPLNKMIPGSQPR